MFLKFLIFFKKPRSKKWSKKLKRGIQSEKRGAKSLCLFSKRRAKSYPLNLKLHKKIKYLQINNF